MSASNIKRKPTASKPKATQITPESYQDGGCDDDNITLRCSKPPSVQSTPASSRFVTEEKLRIIIQEELIAATNSSMKELFKQELQNITQHITSFQDSLAWFSEKYEETKSALATNDEKIKLLQNENNSLRTECDDLKRQVHQLVEDNHNRDQWARRSNIEIVGVPEKKDENLINIVNNLAKISGYNLNASTDIDFVTRVAVKSHNEIKKPKPIVIKLQSRYKKDDFISALRARKDLKATDIGFSECDRIYINDHLTSSNKYLLKRVRSLAQEKNYAMCWVRNCTIMVRRNKESPVIYINKEEDLKKLK